MAIINGTALANLLNGTTQADTINGLEGNDTINGGVGRDTIFGGADNDLIDGGTDNDLLYGESGNDRLLGNSGNDSVHGGAGIDTIDGGSGDDYITGDDTVASGQYGSELIVNGGFEDPDIATGSYGIFPGGITGWTVNSGAIELQDNYPGLIGAIEGAQHLELDSTGNSAIAQAVATTAGETYKVEFLYSPRNDVSADSNPVEVWWNGTLLDTITGTTAGWQLHQYSVSATGASTSLELRSAGTNDSLGGFIDAVSVKQELDFSGADSLNGGSGNDTVYAGGADDFAFGDSGNDRLFGEDGNDTLTDNSGNDYLNGGAGNDTLIDSSGNDTLIGGTGNDTLTGGGGSGKDVFVFASGDGNDVITDFGNGLDKIALTGLGANFAAISAGISQAGADTLINFGAGGTITLLNTNAALIDATDFTFA